MTSLTLVLPPPFYVVTASSLRLRESPSLAATALFALPRGTTVQLLDVRDVGRWSQVRAGKRVGWMASKYLAPVNHPAAPVAESEEFAWMPIALGERGVSEVSGPGDNPRVNEYQRSTELDRHLAANDDLPWCSDFVNWCVEKAGYAGTNSAAARSWLDWGRPIKTPRRGCITILSRGKTGGHVGFYLRRADITFNNQLGLELLGGNQGNQVAIASYDSARLLGYRVPHR